MNIQQPIKSLLSPAFFIHTTSSRDPFELPASVSELFCLNNDAFDENDNADVMGRMEYEGADTVKPAIGAKAGHWQSQTSD